MSDNGKPLAGKSSGATFQQVCQSLLACMGLAYGISILLHLLMIVGLAFWDSEIELIPNRLRMDSALSEKKVGVLPKPQREQPIDLIPQQSGGSKILTPMLIDSNAVTPNRDVNAEIPTDMMNRLSRLAAEGSGTGDAAGAGDNSESVDLPGGGKKGKNAVTAGRFTVWTVPEKPQLNQPYLVVIQVRVLKGSSKYQASDLSGSIVGTDDYRQVIPWDIRLQRRGREYRQHTFRVDARRKKKLRLTWLNPKSRRSFLPVIKGYSRLYIKVPGAREAKVEDRIEIHSKLITKKEGPKAGRKVLTIVFENQ